MSLREFCEARRFLDEHKAPATAGVYVIYDRFTLRAYIGCTSDMSRRIDQHRFMLRKGTHHNLRLQADWDKNGEASFKFEPFQEGENLFEFEKQLIADNMANDCYNWSPNGSYGSPKKEEPMKIRNIRMSDEEWDAVKLIGPEDLRRFVVQRAHQMKEQLAISAKESK